ncbi:MAG: hemerythrin domain-containing protein [Fidelibacterota bacterium]|nr:MAG: hemerythrin domain-containing protein [Candidatus Neomarinimicrobiota bacterium]
MIDEQYNVNRPGSGSRGEELLKSLPEGHVIHTLVNEHVQILGFLRELDALRNRLMQMQTFDESQAILDNINDYTELLLDAESHHLREEQVVCLELEKRGISGQPEIMRQEHNLLRPLKQRLQNLATGGCEKKQFATLQAEIDETMDRVISNLLLHIQKEDKVLYPLSLETIDDPAVWEEMRVHCDEIGYCSFTVDVDH